MHRLALLAVIATLALAALPVAPASAANTNTISGHAALRDYKSYLAQLVAGIPRARAAARSYANRLGCTGAIADSAKLTTASETALFSEIEADIQLRQLSVIAGPLARLAAALNANASTWSDTIENPIIHKFLAAEQALVTTPPSALCADARRFAAAPAAVPLATRRFLAGFQAKSAAAQRSLNAFVDRVLKANEAAGDTQLIDAANRLDSRYQQQFTQLVAPLAIKIAEKLGVSDD